MYFQLLHGIHVEGGKTYRVERLPGKQGELAQLRQPVIKSDKDLVGLFGSNKFKRVSDSEASVLLETGNPSERTILDENASSEGSVSKAVRRGAKDILAPPGREVTEKFTSARDAAVRVFIKNRKYVVTDVELNVLTETPLSKGKAAAFIANQLE